MDGNPTDKDGLLLKHQQARGFRCEKNSVIFMDVQLYYYRLGQVGSWHQLGALREQVSSWDFVYATTTSTTSISQSFTRKTLLVQIWRDPGNCKLWNVLKLQVMCAREIFTQRKFLLFEQVKPCFPVVITFAKNFPSKRG